MSYTFDNSQYRDVNQAQSDRLQQFRSPENGNGLMVDMANPTEARLAGRFSQASSQNGEQTLPHTGHLNFDDPYASTVGNGNWNAQNWADSFRGNGATGGAEQSFPGEFQIEKQLGKLEQELSNLVSLLEGYESGEAAFNAPTTAPGDAQPANTTNSGGAEIPNTLPIDIPPTNTAAGGAINNAVTAIPGDNPPTDSPSSVTNNDTSTSTQGGTEQQNTAPPAGSNDSTTGSGNNENTSVGGSNDSTSGGGSNDNTSSTSNNSSTDNPNQTVTTDSNANTNTATGATAGDGSGFQVNNGKITYNGETLAGVNVSSQYAQSISPQALANQLSSDLPGINVVRLLTSPEGGSFSSDIQIQNPESTSDIQADIQALNAKGIGVIIGNHSADVSNANNVSQDGNEAQWFATLAQQNLGNNGVMFQTQNEPTGSNQDIVNEQVAVYNAVRATGSNNVVAFDLGGGDSASPQLSDPSAYDSMSNYAIDAHAYVADSTPVSDMQWEAGQTASLTEANGQAVPVYFGETGNSIEPPNIQSTANQLLQAEFTDGNGAIAFNFDHAPFALDGSSQADNMLDGSGNLNAYGQYIASLIQQSNSQANG